MPPETPIENQQPFPNDPASLRGARENPNYIGPTNFANIQKQYTPYQIEQATERQGADIFWKQGVNIADIPSSAPSTTLQPDVAQPPVPANTLSSTIPTVTSPNPQSAEFEARNKAASQYLTGLQAQIDSMRSMAEARLAEEKKAQQGKVDSLKSKLGEILNTTDYQSSLEKDRELFQMKQKIDDLNMVQTKIADASAALNQGLIFEEGRATRMELLVGRSAELKKQGLAHLQALQTSAEVIKGNIDLARAYADDSISAIKMDNDRKINALNTLLSLENQALIEVTAEEKETIKARMNALADEAKSIEARKEQLFTLAQENPQAFSKGGVTFLDSMDAALKKMMPYLSEQQKMAIEEQQLQNELLRSQISENNAQAYKARTGGSGGSGGGGAAAGESSIRASMAQDAAALRAQGYPEDEIRQALMQAYGGVNMKTTELVSIMDNVLQGAPNSLTPQQQLAERVDKTRQELELKGLLELDAETGKYVSTPNRAQIEEAQSKSLVHWDSEKGAWRKGNKFSDGEVIADPSKISVGTHSAWYLSESMEMPKLIIK